MEKDNVFCRALSCICLEEAFDQIQIEFAGLCNQITSADKNPVREREELRAVVKKACGYLSIGLERLCGNRRNLDDNQMAALIKTYPLTDIFRIGYSLISDLKHKTEKWIKSAWFSKRGFALSFWGEELVGAIGGLLIKRPRFFDNYKTGVLYREFETLQDVEQTRAALDEAVAFDHLLSRLSINTGALPKNLFVTHKNLILTSWTRSRLGLTGDSFNIPIAVFKDFYEGLWEKTGPTPCIRQSQKTNFLRWLAKECDVAEDEISAPLGKALERLFSEIADEYCNIKVEDLDPRFAGMFMLSRE